MTDSSSHEVPQFNEDFRNNPYGQRQKPFNLEDLLDRELIELDTKNISDFLRNKRILITGAAGSIGRNLIKQILLFKPKRLFLIDLSETGIYELEEELTQFPIHEVEIIVFPANITDPVRMKDLFQRCQPQIVFHAAAYKHVPIMEKHPYEAIKTNVLGTKILANLAVDFWVEKFVFISTDKAVNPSSVMGASKRCCEMYLQSLDHDITINTQFIIARFGNVLGTNGSAILRFREQIKKGGPVTITHPEVMRYFITMKEACQLVLESGAIGKTGEVFIFDMGDKIFLKDLVQKMIRLSGLKINTDIKIVYTGLRAGEKLIEERLLGDEENIPSHDAKITISHPKPVDKILVREAIQRLENALEQGEENELVLILKDAIPEYISRNSEFEKLDILRAAKVEKTIME